ncbi:hypothetical protein QFC20_007773 [Naganishia adeliensis]|uniref:Uncharacterized protein n=1 Tax=Naganishia adeliensis TaxID=92952 RepID=A0ACC2UX72_9TREE|nr:hypothetical protein QFC20_007773 [Naganishia adeliensis]
MFALLRQHCISLPIMSYLDTPSAPRRAGYQKHGTQRIPARLAADLLEAYDVSGLDEARMRDRVQKLRRRTRQVVGAMHVVSMVHVQDELGERKVRMPDASHGFSNVKIVPSSELSADVTYNGRFASIAARLGSAIGKSVGKDKRIRLFGGGVQCG